MHFIAGRTLDEEALEPVLSALEEPSGDVEKFYEFSLKTAWQHMSEVTKNILRYSADSNVSVTWQELSSIQKIKVSEKNISLRELKKWYLLEDEIDAEKHIRYNIHPWIKHSLRGGLVDRW